MVIERELFWKNYNTCRFEKKIEINLFQILIFDRINDL